MIYEFNCFSFINDISNEITALLTLTQNSNDEAQLLNFLVYMDEVEDGGTAVYGGEWVTNDENINLLYLRRREIQNRESHRA